MNVEEQETQIAGKIRAQLGDTTNVEDVVVKGDLLQLHVTKDFYERLAVDRERGRKIMLALMQQMKTLSGLEEVMVCVYCEKDKMIEAKTKRWGGDNVIYCYDL
ncbi:MAG: hypothetical protein O2999_12945 [Nitrospirae bacterium]|nr:hypothetical protein [Nitrospirota bacterium]MDA1305180.1 hypothetical protein [Nitrospirota bacterium]